MGMLERGHLVQAIGSDNFFWSADRAILTAERRYPCLNCQIKDYLPAEMPPISQ
jgi:hypothetical protein